MPNGWHCGASFVNSVWHGKYSQIRLLQFFCQSALDTETHRFILLACVALVSSGMMGTVGLILRVSAGSGIYVG